MRVKSNLKEAAGSLSASMQRSLLALIGIVIGISSVIAMVSVGMIVKGEAVRQFEALGTDILTIRNISHDPGTQRGTAATIRVADALDLTKLSTVAASAPYMTHFGRAVVAGKEAGDAHLVGTVAAFGTIHELAVEDGRFISDLDRQQYYAVIGSEIAAALHDGGVERAVGAPIRIDDVIYTVVGVLRDGVRGPPGIGMSRAVITPVATAQRVFPNPELRGIVARMSPNVHYLAATAQIKDYFRRQSEALVVRVESPERLIEQMNKQMRLFTLLLGTVGSISLIVGGVGVMNVMLTSVTERRLEIGIRRALGARQRDIQSQFLFEAVILSLLGGILGIALGIGTTYALCLFAGWTFLVSTVAIGLGVGAAGVTGIFFGLYPAWQAARLDPITALRGT